MEFAVGTLTTAGCTYSCKITYDTPTRSGDDVTIKNVKATITSSSQYQTRNRIAVSVSINGSSQVSNKEMKRANPDINDDYFPTSAEVTVVGSSGYSFSCLSKTFSISATFRATGYGTNWNNNQGSASESGEISCPARTYSVTYDANGGSGAPAAQSKEYNVTLTLSSTIPTYSGFEFKGWKSGNTTYQPGGSYAGNAALSLTAVWQALTTDLEDVDDTAIGAAPEVAFTPLSASLTYKIAFSLGEWSHTTDMISPGSTGRYVFSSYTLPMEVCNQLPDTTESLMQVDLETYSSGTKTGTDTKYFTVTVPDTVVPTVNSSATTLAEDNGLHVFLQNYTQVKGTLNCSRAYGSDIVEVKMTIGEDVKTVVPTQSTLDPTKFDAVLTSDVLAGLGSTTVTYTITDTRGRTKTHTSTITVYEYNPPSATIDITYDGNKIITDTIVGHFSSISGANSATISVNGGTARSFTDGAEYIEQIESDYNRSRNHTCTVVITDLVTSVTVTKTLRPGRGDRFGRLYDSKYYVGMDEEGWKRTDATFDGGITEDGVIWIERTGGTGPLGIGFPVVLEQDTDYELIYSTGIMDEPAAFVSFFRETSPSEIGTYYVSTTYDGGYLKSGDIFHTPKFTMSFKLWGVVVLGAIASDNTVRNEYSDVILRKIARSEESLAWDLETGNLGLDTPNQKYISRIQQRVDYSGSLKVEIAYDNADDYSTVHESTSDHMRSITVPIKVKRSDHFRIRLSGTGEVRLYSFGYQTDEGGDRCLI